MDEPDTPLAIRVAPPSGIGPYKGFARPGTHPYAHDFTLQFGFLFVWRGTEENKKGLNW